MTSKSLDLAIRSLLPLPEQTLDLVFESSVFLFVKVQKTLIGYQKYSERLVSPRLSPKPTFFEALN